jgi:UDP-N-acetylglucosamine--N-acetylmuramyl-(pentapeptide) pyrophosphoryl-undecaprenol N-acetylglucosamine transferase
VGGGSGGHITPIAAIISSLREQKPRADIRVWCDRSFATQARQLLGTSTRVDIVVSGKYRRYANLSWWAHFRRHLIRTHLANFIDLFKIGFGFLQSLFKLIVWRPKVVFCKGGYVCLPVGLAAHVLRIPLVIHDSDTVPGLTNRILARYASYIGTGAPVENYPNYPRNRTKFVGIPVRTEFHKLSTDEKIAAKEKIGLDGRKKLVLATGGGLGSSELSRVVVKEAPEIIDHDAQILLLIGESKNLAVPEIDGLMVRPFLTDDYSRLAAAADVVITRAGATAMAEFASVGAATIVVPNPFLAGDHQTKNAMIWQKADATIVIEQKDLQTQPGLLSTEIIKLLDDDKLRSNLSKNLAKFARPDALDQMVKMILEALK